MRHLNTATINTPIYTVTAPIYGYKKDYQENDVQLV